MLHIMLYIMLHIMLRIMQVVVVNVARVEYTGVFYSACISEVDVCGACSKIGNM